MEVDMKRSTKTAPVSLSTSYLTGSPCMGISMTTLQSFGRSRPAGTRSRLTPSSVYRRALGSGRRHAVRRGCAPAALIACMCMLCAPAIGEDAAAVSVQKFSAAKAGSTIPAPWAPVKINDRKTPTRYDLVDDGGTIVLHAMADKAASALGQQVNASVDATPWLRWRWKIEAPIADADNAVAQKED